MRRLAEGAGRPLIQSSTAFAQVTSHVVEGGGADRGDRGDQELCVVFWSLCLGEGDMAREDELLILRIRYQVRRR